MENKEILLSCSEMCGCRKFAAALNELTGISGKKSLVLEKGIYRFDKADSMPVTLPVSNTIDRNDSQIKHIGLLLENIDDLTIEGSGAKLLMNGDMSAIVIKNCRNITLKDLVIDYVFPRVSEMTVVEIEGNSLLFSISPDSRWKLDKKGHFCWINGDGITETFESRQVVQRAAADGSSNLRQLFNPVREAVKVELISEFQVKFSYTTLPPVEIGEVWQFRDPSRRENGVVIVGSENITFNGMELNFTPGLGIVAQMSRDIAILNHRHAPASGSSRVCAAHADCIQVSSCYGKVEIANGFFSGSQDDPINIHGTYLGVEKISGREVELRFCQPETWGWMPFSVGDELSFVRKSDFQRAEKCRVEKLAALDGDRVELIVDREICTIGKPEDFVVENLSAYPDVEIRNCIFECYPTRGLLLTSAGKCRVHDNEFRQTAARPAIYISADVNSWYESGGVQDVKIYHNRFRFSTAPVIDILPEVPQEGKEAVHRNIEIFDNSFENCSSLLLRYRSVENLKTDIAEKFIEKAGFTGRK